MFNRAVKAAAALAVGFLCTSVLSIWMAPIAIADGCNGGRAPFTSWSVCDYDWQPNGAHTHCDAVFVFGFGGWNCYPVSPPAPQGVVI